jgi:phospholipid-translocating ATPase
MSFFIRRRHAHPDQLEADDHDTNVDQDLRLRTVRTAASTIAESVASEQRAERRRSVRNKRSKFFRSKSTKSPELETPVEDKSTIQIAGKRRNIYVNMPLSAMEVDRQGDPVQRYARNKVKTTSELGSGLLYCTFSCPAEYTIMTFVPKNLYEQFRRHAFLHVILRFN